MLFSLHVQKSHSRFISRVIIWVGSSCLITAERYWPAKRIFFAHKNQDNVWNGEDSRKSKNKSK